MKREDIIRMAREAGFEVHDRKQQARVGMDALLGIDSTDKLERFATIVAAAEREACAKVCDDFEHGNWEYMQGSMICAAAIRARSTP